MLILGWAGMPRRYYSYLPKFTDLQVIATVGSWIMVGGLGMMFGNLLYAFFSGKKAEDNPWGGATLEWQLPSPPPRRTSRHPPVITHGPYVFDGTEREKEKEGLHGHVIIASAPRIGMWLFLLSEILIFGGLFLRVRGLPGKAPRRISMLRRWS